MLFIVIYFRAALNAVLKCVQDACHAQLAPNALENDLLLEACLAPFLGRVS